MTMPKKKTMETTPAETTPVVETPAPVSRERNFPKGPALMRINVRVVSPDGATLLRTEVCDVYLESTISYSEDQLVQLGGVVEAARSFAERVLTPLAPLSEPTAEEAIRAVQRQTIRVPVPGEAISLVEARKRDLGNDNFHPRAGTHPKPAEAQKVSKPASTPFTPFLE
jgi:hypothetical protein